jgi:CubicO group peptidase (beta-lactamase class C family)
MKVSDVELLGPDFSANNKGDITVRNLLLHNSGFPPDPYPNYCT